MPSTCDNAALFVPANKGAKPAILLVEDEEAVRSVLTRFLSAKGFRVFAASDAPAAQSIWNQRSEEIDLLVTDVMLPNGMSGRRLGLLLQDQKPGLEVILMSGYNTEFAELAPGSTARTQFLPKPYRPDDLLGRIRNALSIPSFT